MVGCCRLLHAQREAGLIRDAAWLCLWENTFEKHFVLKEEKKKKIVTAVILAIEGFGRLSSPLLLGFFSAVF